MPFDSWPYIHDQQMATNACMSVYPFELNNLRLTAMIPSIYVMHIFTESQEKTFYLFIWGFVVDRSPCRVVGHVLLCGEVIGGFVQESGGWFTENFTVIISDLKSLHTRFCTEIRTHIVFKRDSTLQIAILHYVKQNSKT